MTSIRSRHAQAWPLLFFGIAGLLLLFGGLIAGWKQNQILTTWPQIDATVVQSRLLMKGPTSYSGEITLRYNAGGQRKVTVSPGFESSVRQIMQEKLKQFPAGSLQRVRLDPNNPEHLVFSAGYTPEFFMTPLVLGLTGLLFLGIGLAPRWMERAEGGKKSSHSAPTNRPTAPTDRLPLLIGGTFAFIGALILGVALLMNLNLRSRQTWPQTQATVSRSRVINYSSGGTNGNPTRTYYAMEIEFRYKVDNHQFAAPLTVGSGVKSRERLDALLPQFAAGTRHRIRYNPDNPNAITFESEGSLWVWIIAAMGGGFLGIGLLCLLAFRASVGRTQPS